MGLLYRQNRDANKANVGAHTVFIAHLIEGSFARNRGVMTLWRNHT